MYSKEEILFMKELWKDIKEYEGIYQVINLGRVKRVETDMVLKGRLTQTGGYTFKYLNEGDNK